MIADEDIIEVAEPHLTAADKLYFPQIAAGLETTMRHLLGKKMTVQYPEQRREDVRVDNYRGVHRLNRDEQGRVACVACFMCETACPANCIHIEGGAAPWDDREKYPRVFEIDELRCIYCGMCEEACPVDAVELTPEFSVVGRTRAEMIFDKDKLLEVFDQTRDAKSRKNPPITGYRATGGEIPRSPGQDADAGGEGT